MTDESRHTEEALRAEIERLKAQLRQHTGNPVGPGGPSSTLSRLHQFAPFAVENLSDATYVINKDARLIYVNRAACCMLGYDEQEMLAMTLYQISPTLTPQIWDMVWNVTMTERKQTAESEHRTKDGRMIPVEILANAIEVDGVEYSCSFTRDITERRKLESRMRQVEKMEAIGQLAGGIAHDFNNQLAGIVGYADLLKLELRDRPDLAELAEGILTAAMRSAGLTRQLLAFARKGKNLSVSLDLHAIIGEVAQMVERSVDKRIVIKTELRAVPAVTIGDPSQLQNAILNLAINARDAMPQGGTLTFSSEIIEHDRRRSSANLRQLDSGRYIQIGVSDTGVGMDPDTERRIFEPFFTTKETGKGTGMGLPAVYGTVKNHRGAIQVRTAIGHGTTVEILLPLAAEVVTSAETDDEPTVHMVIQARVLLVEDEAAVRDMASAMLQRFGCQVVTAASGREAVERYREIHRQIDVVILDLVMPEMSGRDTFRQLRLIDRDLVAILASGYSLDGEVQTILDEGAKAFIQKPFRATDLGKKLMEVLSSDAGQ